MVRARTPFWRLGTIVPTAMTTFAGLTAVAVMSLSAPTTATTSFTDGSPIGVVEQVRAWAGGVMVIGWDFDPDARRTPLYTWARVDGKWAAAMTADLDRPDVATAHPAAGPNHGFRFFVPVPEGNHRVCVAARNIDKGSDNWMWCTSRTFNYGPVGKLEVLKTTPGHLVVKGWSFDRDDIQAPVTVNVGIDGTVTKLVANIARPDIGQTYPAAGPDHGFAATLPLKQGTHNVCVTETNIGLGSNQSLGCKTITLNDNPLGAVDSAGQQNGKLRVTGWTFDNDAPTTPLTVDIKVDGTTHAIVANGSRTDIGTKYPSAGNNHGFAASYTLAEGSHSVCVTAVNIGYGANASFGCRTVVLNFTPSAGVTSLAATKTGAVLQGWASDPDTSSAISVQITADGHDVGTVTANGSGTSHDGHNFRFALKLKSGSHTVCAIGLNTLYGTHNSKPACSAITLALKPLGAFESLHRATGATNLVATGWTFDPDTTSPITVRVTLDGTLYGTAQANIARSDIASKYPGFGTDHGFATTVKTDAGEHTVCVTAVNVSGGSNLSLGCKLIFAVHPVAPSAPQNVSVVAGYGGAEITWTAPTSDGGAPWTNYTVTASPGGQPVTVGPAETGATVLGLKPSTSYIFTVTATNVAGTSPAATSASVMTQASPPPQTTPAPVSTSRYIRNIRGASATDQATMKSEGATDAYYNPSGHGYLILLDIGGQDQFDGGVVLSATTRFVTYSDLVTDLKAYVDGYHSKQKASAPITIAIGTNNDMDVSSASGSTWATKVVNPVATYVKNHYSGITIAGANDIEPGFRASYSATKAWLNGYLGATKVPFVFNGSADGCSWTTINRGCNNGWQMSGLYYLAAGAAPVRMLNLPQIYNTTMAAQWKYISLTGVAASQPRINFAGPLTEWTACAQTNSCGSLTGHTAWSTMWSNLQSDARLKVSSLPYSTDLRIDK